jgi:phenylpropionate dioxygenase-like ring-hydroxylating dioxygenase large terminal subunit
MTAMRPVFPFPRLPYGWFLSAYSREIASGEVRTFRYFGEELVIYRDADGAVHALEAHCPHLGAHLGAGGCVDGDGLRCPFHGWRFAADGRCVEVPYSPRVPRVGMRAWPIVERGGLIFLWHDPDGGAPAFDLPDFEGEEYTERREVDFVLRSHPQELMENTADIAHFGYLHGARNHRYLRDWRAHGPLADTLIGFSASGAALGAPVDWIDLEINFALHGLGYLVIDTHVPSAFVDARVRVCATPIDEDHVRVFFLSNIRRMPDPAFTSMVERLFHEAALADFKQDMKIWQHKVYRPRPVLVPGDGPILAYREWARQFYAPRTAQAQ